MTEPGEFCVLILSHGRPRNVKTVKSMLRAKYSGPWFIVCDDEDPTLDEYRRVHGEDRIVVFSKDEIAETFDEGDNFPDRRCIVYARNASFGIARKLGFRYFIQLDDDYNVFRYRFDGQYRFATTRCNLDAVWGLMFDFFRSTPESVASIAMGQGGDYLGGGESRYMSVLQSRRKAMNSFLCDTEREFPFLGKLNEDVNAYTASQRSGLVFLTILQVWLDQTTTQANAGGMSDIYLDQGTYTKTFYSVMRCPSGVRVGAINSEFARIHHRIKWNAVAPKIVPESVRKPRLDQTV